MGRLTGSAPDVVAVCVEDALQIHVTEDDMCVDFAGEEREEE